MTFRFIDDHTDEWPVAWMCETREVSASGYYAWAARPESAADQWRQEMVAAIEEIHERTLPPLLPPTHDPAQRELRRRREEQ